MEETEIQEQIKQLKLEYRDIKSVLESVSRDLNNTVHLRGALSGAGAAAELILKCVYRREKVVDSKIPSDRAYEIKKVESEKMMLDELIRSVENFLPLRVVTHLRTIQAWRNIGSHSKGQVSESVNQATLQVVSLALSELVTWFIVEYLNHDLDFFANIDEKPKGKAKADETQNSADELDSVKVCLWKIWTGTGDNLRYGFINEFGEVVVQPIFENVYIGNQTESKVCVTINGKWGVIDFAGNWIFQPTIDFAPIICDGFAVISLNGKFGVKKESGEWLIHPVFDSISEFEHGCAFAGLSNKFGIIDLQGKWIVQPIYDNFETASLASGFFIVEVDGKWGVVNSRGAWVLDPNFDLITTHSEGVFGAEKDGFFGYVDLNGAWVIEPRFHSGSSFEEGRAVVRVDDLFGIIDTSGNWIIKPQFIWPPLFNSGRYIINDGFWGILNLNGTWLIEPKFRSLGLFVEGLAYAIPEEGGRYGYIDNMGNWVIQPMFDSAGSFNGGLALVSLNGKYGYINKLGNWVFQPTMDEEDVDLDFDLDIDDFELENEDDESNESESLEFYAEDFNLEDYFSKVSSKLKIQDEIDRSKVNTFLSNLGGGDYREACKDYEMWVFYDDTFWQSGKEGFLIMSDSDWVYFYYKLHSGHGAFTFAIDQIDEGLFIKEMNLEQGELIATISEDNEEDEFTFYGISSEVRDALYNFYVNEIEPRKCFE
jgi:hypothetical protein